MDDCPNANLLRVPIGKKGPGTFAYTVKNGRSESLSGTITQPKGTAGRGLSVPGMRRVTPVSWCEPPRGMTEKAGNR